MTKFNFLLDQIKAHDVKVVLTILQTAKSKLIQVKIVQIFNYISSFFFSNGEYLMEKLLMQLMNPKIMYDIYTH